MTVENWGGNLVLVTAELQRTTSYGIVSFIRRSALARRLIDPLDAIIRRFFIREFVRSDVDRSAGIRFHPERMIDADKGLVEYLGWLQSIHRSPKSKLP